MFVPFIVVTIGLVTTVVTCVEEFIAPNDVKDWVPVAFIVVTGEFGTTEVTYVERWMRVPIDVLVEFVELTVDIGIVVWDVEYAPVELSQWILLKMHKKYDQDL